MLKKTKAKAILKEKVLIVLWTTSRCNLNCKYCYAAAWEKRADMDFETAKAALDYFADCSMKVQFAGGEPLLNVDLICRVVEYAKSNDYDVAFQMQTNGTLITPEIATGIKKMKIAVGVSLDGPPAINEKLRGKTNAAVNGIKLLGQAGIRANINAVVTKQNVSELPNLVTFAFYLGNVPGIGLDLIREAGNAKSGLVEKASPLQLTTALKGMQRKSEELFRLSGRWVKLREIEAAKNRLKCSSCAKDYCYAACGRSFVILPDGDVYPCGSLIDKYEYFMGNIKYGKMKVITLAKIMSDNCRDCSYYSICPGGCPSRLIVNNIITEEQSLDCVLKKTAFDMVRQKQGN
ncbi:radical SAM protein [Acetobacterium paludosum]|uniref:Radical SAM protein n=1 Tax=Acetobacterium paludosum TaxID=52693 RepID=A0A923KWB5_9FIRM|nr:radical SAM protein [Acetobacterium paludosum]MBC3887883.1 radical SAM protein [Acetobacterium paludosum]